MAMDGDNEDDGQISHLHRLTTYLVGITFLFGNNIITFLGDHAIEIAPVKSYYMKWYQEQ